MSTRVVCIYFVIKDSFAFVRKYIYIKSKSAAIAQILSFSILYLLLANIYITTILLIIGSLLINLFFNIRNNEINIINKYLEIEGTK